MGNVETKKTPAARGTGRARATRATTVAAGAESSTTAVPAETFRASKGRPLTQSHKEAIAIGRGEALVIGRYLDALNANRPRPGRRRTASSIETRLADIDNELGTAAGVERLKLVQERIDLQAEVGAASPAEWTALVEGFVAVAASYSTRRGISRAAWRELDVPAAVLQQAGITR